MCFGLLSKAFSVMEKERKFWIGSISFTNMTIRFEEREEVKLYFSASLRRVGGSRVTATLSLNLGIIWQWVVNVTPRPLYPRGGIPVLIEQQAGWAPHADWTLSGRENSVVLTGVPTLDCSARSIVAVPTTLVRYNAVFWELLNSYRRRQFSEITLSPVFRFGIISEEVIVGVHLRPVQQMSHFMVTPCIKNIQHLIVQLMHTTLKNVELLKHF